MHTLTCHLLLQQDREENSEKVLADDLTVWGNTSVQKESPSTHQNEGFVLEMPVVSFENRAKVSKVDINNSTYVLSMHSYVRSYNSLRN